MLRWIFDVLINSLHTDGNNVAESKLLGLILLANQKDTLNILLETLPFFLVGCVFIDGIQAILSGMLKGIEKKSVVSNSTTIVYYFIGAPLIAYFTFPIGFGLDLKGIWLGFGICNLILLIIFLHQLISTDWEH